VLTCKAHGSYESLPVDLSPRGPVTLRVRTVKPLRSGLCIEWGVALLQKAGAAVCPMILDTFEKV
jgi:hypothetical protein